jgi:hypothetical protein
MKCAICGGKTDWSSSFGYKEFIVCYPCYTKLVPSNADDGDALDFIFTCGQIRRDKKKEKGD